MLVKVNPFNSLLNHHSLLDNFFQGNIAAPVHQFEPRIDVSESEKEFMISAELPGLSREDFKLTVENNLLTLEGEKKSELEDSGKGYYGRERLYGAFKRSFRLTDSLDSKKINADFKNGVLEITIPKAEKAKPKQVEISVS